MAAIATTRQLSPVIPQADVPDESAHVAPVVSLAARRSTRVLLGMAAALILFVGVFAVVRSERATDDEASYAADLARVMEQADARIVDLAPADGVEGSFRVAWSSSLGEAVLIGENLPATADGTAYELW
ncbi:MAG TPA: hypothetical protein DCR14_09210, partial [Acidimicrobiaceae bacterium]|nr:hypothetical protein [Acidimicrobiaceae bacterium]